MSIFDKTVSEFLKSKEDVHICNIDKVKMKFSETHGYYICPKNKIHIKAPQILISNKNKKPIKLFWTNCPDCGKNNVTDETQEAYLVKINMLDPPVDGKKIELVKIPVKNQQKITCTHCNKKFLKKE